MDLRVLGHLARLEIPKKTRMSRKEGSSLDIDKGEESPLTKYNISAKTMQSSAEIIFCLAATRRVADNMCNMKSG